MPESILEYLLFILEIFGVGACEHWDGGEQGFGASSFEQNQVTYQLVLCLLCTWMNIG